MPVNKVIACHAKISLYYTNGIIGFKAIKISNLEFSQKTNLAEMWKMEEGRDILDQESCFI